MRFKLPRYAPFSRHIGETRSNGVALDAITVGPMSPIFYYEMAKGRSYPVRKFELDTSSLAACVDVFLPNFTVP